MKELQFKDFDPSSPVRVYWRNLPHWRQDGATYFVTFRLADSIPEEIAAIWAAERNDWLQSRGITDELPEKLRRSLYLSIPSRERQIFERRQARHLFSELDRGYGRCTLRNPACRDRLCTALKFFDGSSIGCGDFVIMPNHVHWLVLPHSGTALEEVLKSVKQYASTEINRLGACHGKLWQKEGFDHIVRDRQALERIRCYIRDNPRKARLSADEYTHYEVEWN